MDDQNDGIFFQKLEHLFQISEKGRVDLPHHPHPPPTSSYSPEFRSKTVF